MTLSPKEEAVLVLIKDPVYENYFFNKVSDVKWFETLKEKGYFKPEKAPGPIPADEQGTVSLPFWNVLPYLEKVSRKVGEPGNEQYLDDLLNIIRNVTQYHMANNKCLNNYRTWEYFVKILVNIPNERISLEILDLIRIWLESNYAGSALGDDLALKLLPKFLSDEPIKGNSEKAEKIFEYLTAVTWPDNTEDKSKSAVRIEKEPNLVIDHHWLTESLINKKHIHKIGERCSDKLIFKIADMLKNIFKIQMSPSGFDVTIDSEKYRIIVNHIKDFTFECFGGKIDDEKRKELELTERLYRQLSYIPNEEFKFELKVCKDNTDFASRMVSEFKKLNKGKVEIGLYERMILFYKNIFNDFSYIWYKHLAEMPRWIGQSDAKELLVLFLRELIVAKTKINRNIGREIIDIFLSEKYQYPLFKRFVLYVISEFWDDYHDIFEKLLQPDNAVEWFENINYEVELYVLLEKNVRDFSPGIKKGLGEIIGNGPNRNYDVEDKQKYADYWRQKWYSALKADNDFVKLYDEYRSKTGIKEYVSAHEPAVQTRTGLGKSPMTVEQMLSKPNSEIAEALTSFETKDWWEGPTEEALADSLKQVIKEQPAKFLDDLEPFIGAAYLYIVYLLWGLRDAWNNKTEFDWGKLFAFIKRYIERDEFWQDKLPLKGDHWKPDHNEVIRTLGSLIQDGTKEDSWAFNGMHNDRTKNIFGIILDDAHITDLKSGEKEEQSDYLSKMHNTSAGEIIIALIYLSLRIVRLQDRENQTEKRWDDDLKTLYEKIFANDVVEAYTAFGQYLPNIMYLDKEWTEQKIKEIEQPKQDTFRKAFMTGYLNIMRVYDNIYDLMQNHYKWAMDTALPNHTSEQLVSHITIGYLRGNSQLFDMIIGKWHYAYIQDTINFFSRESKFLLKPEIENRDLMIERVIDFWKKIHEKYSAENAIQSEDDKKILSNVTRLTEYLSEIDETAFDWLMLSVPYVHVEHNEHWLLEYLDRLKGEGNPMQSTKYILHIILKMLESNIFIAAADNMKSIVIFAYELKNDDVKQMANDICNIFGAAGLGYLRPVYEKYNE